MKAGPWVRHLAALVICGSVYFGFAAAQPGEEKKTPPKSQFPLPKVLQKNTPAETVQDLREIEQHVEKVLKKVMPSIVGLRVGVGQGSGVIIKTDGTILTAGHVSGKPEQTAAVILPDGKTLKGRTLGQNKGIDSGMVKISDGSNYPAVEMGNSADLKPGQWVIAIGHPGGFRKNRTPVVRVGRVLVANAFLIRTDCALVGGDSGGPLFDMQGRVVGIHSRIGGSAITENVHVPVNTFRETWDKLAAGESWGAGIGQTETVKSAGGKLVFEKKDTLTIQDPMDTIQQNSYAKQYTFKMKAGHTYTIDLISSDKSGKKLDTFLRLESPTGKKLAMDDDGGGFPHSRIVHKSILDGDYKIIATSFEGNQTGAFVLKVFDADFVDALVSGKVDVLKAVRIPLPAITPLLEKLLQVKIAPHINAVLVDAKGLPQANKEIVVQWEKGSQKLKSNSDGVVRWALAKDKTRKLSIELPKDVRAMLALTDKDGQSLGLFSKEDPTIEKVKSGGGKIVKTIEGDIKKTDPFDIEREKCWRHVHEFKLQAGKTYTLDLSSEDFDAYLRLEHDEKGKLAEDDDGAGSLNSRIVYTADADGVYRIVVTTCDPGQLGTYRLTIREADGKPATPKKDAKKVDKK